jgi:predicted alpha/beta hydrolase
VVGAATAAATGRVSDVPPPVELALAAENPDARSRGWLLPAADPRAPVAMLVPALGVSARSYRRLGEALQRCGIHAACADLRGVGSSPVRASRAVDWGYLDLVDDEMSTLYDEVAARLPQAPRLWVGHSLGGQLALLHQARHPQRPVRRVVLAASGSPWHRRYPLYSRAVVRGIALAARLMSRHLGVFRGDLFGFGGTQGGQLMREWSSYSACGRLGRLGSQHWDADQALAQLSTPITGIVMRADLYAPASSSRHLAGMNAGAFDLQRVERVDGRRPGHFRWLRHPQAVATLITEAAHRP